MFYSRLQSMTSEMENIKTQLQASQESLNPADGGPVPKVADLQAQVVVWPTLLRIFNSEF